MQGKAAAPSILLINQVWFADELRALGARVFSVGWNGEGLDFTFARPGIRLEDLLEQIRPAFEPTHLVYFDDSGPISLTGLERTTLPVIFYSVDTHHHWGWHKLFAATADLVLAAQLSYLEVFAGLNVHWFPLWADLVPPSKERTIDVCFRGNLARDLHPQRAEFFAKVSRQVPVDTCTAPWHAAYPRAKIVLNQAVKDDLNFRVFEALSAGALLVTPGHTQGLLELFRPGEDLVIYENGNVDEAAEKLKYYLKHEDERAHIAGRGYAKILSHHTRSARAAELLSLLLKTERSARPGREVHAAMAYLGCALICAGRRIERVARDLTLAASRILRDVPRPEPELMSDLETGVISCKYMLKAVELSEFSAVFVQELAAKHPDSVMLQMADIERMLECGQGAAARIRAAEISDRPEELLCSIPALMETIRAQLSRCPVPARSSRND